MSHALETRVMQHAWAVSWGFRRHGVYRLVWCIPSDMYASLEVSCAMIGLVEAKSFHGGWVIDVSITESPPIRAVDGSHVVDGMDLLKIAILTEDFNADVIIEFFRKELGHTHLRIVYSEITSQWIVHLNDLPPRSWSVFKEVAVYLR